MCFIQQRNMNGVKILLNSPKTSPNLLLKADAKGHCVFDYLIEYFQENIVIGYMKIKTMVEAYKKASSKKRNEICTVLLV